MIYPPDDHFLRALASEIRIGGDGTCTALLPMNPHLCNDQGGVRLGVIAALVDIAGATILGELLHLLQHPVHRIGAEHYGGQVLHARLG